MSNTNPITYGGMSGDDPQPSRSADTIRHLPLRLAVPLTDAGMLDSPRYSQPASPHSSLPSPSSPSGSVSSLPSVSSSFLFSSGPGSPPQHPHDPDAGDNSLIIPSLTLPSPVRRPTAYGQTLGEVRLLVLGCAGSNSEEVVRVFAEEDCEDVVEVGQWEDFEDEPYDLVRAKVLRLSTDWIEHRDAHGLEKHEPSRNVEIVHLREYSLEDDPNEVLRSALAVVQSPFRTLAKALHPHQSPNELLASLLSSPGSPLFTAMVLVPTHQLSALEQRLITELSTHVPLIVLSSVSPSPHPSHPHRSPYSRRPSLQPVQGVNISAHLPSIRPSSVHSLRACLLHTPEALSSLRLEAAERFLRWREVERAVGRVMGLSSPDSGSEARSPEESIIEEKRKRRLKWDKARWEAQWEGDLATDVAKTVRARRGRRLDRRLTVTASRPLQRTPKSVDVGVETVRRQPPADDDEDENRRPISFDPLHLPSLLVFSLSLLGPLKSRLIRMLSFGGRRERGRAVYARGADEPNGGVPAWFLVSAAFCAGVGVGVLLSKS